MGRRLWHCVYEAGAACEWMLGHARNYAYLFKVFPVV